MAKPKFARYDASMPATVKVFYRDGFREQVGDIFRAHAPKSHQWVADFNVLVGRLATGTRLSKVNFAPEPPGFAFRCGPLRFYGVFGTKHGSCFALSHVIYKKSQKLSAADQDRMKAVVAEFDVFLSS